jgi:antitoxin MazE
LGSGSSYPAITVTENVASDAASQAINQVGRGVKASVKKWGNSAAVRIPAAVMQAVHLELDEAVDVREEAGRIVIEPVRRKVYDLDTLLKGITPRNRHESVDFGLPSGKEVW